MLTLSKQLNAVYVKCPGKYVNKAAVRLAKPAVQQTADNECIFCKKDVSTISQQLLRFFVTITIIGCSLQLNLTQFFLYDIRYTLKILPKLRV